MSDSALQTCIAELKHTATTNQFPPEQLSGFSLILTNIGSLGIKYGTPMVISPCVCSIAIGRLEEKPRIDSQGQLSQTTVLPISVSFDHRAITGLECAKFIHAFASAINA